MMKIATVAASTSLIIGCLVIGGLAGTALGGTVQSAEREVALQTNSDGKLINEEQTDVKFEVNEFGETYGRGDLAQTPDLILAIGDNGKEGYVRDSELYPELPKTPEERAVYRDYARSVPLYDKDGKTVIGTFTLQEGYSGTVEPHELDPREAP